MEELILALKAAREALSLFKDIWQKNLPDSPQNEIVKGKLQEAERSFQIAEAQIAQHLGYLICRCSWPPQIMHDISRNSEIAVFECPKCKKTEKIDDQSDDGFEDPFLRMP